METNRLTLTDRDNVLGEFLKERRARLDPAAFGFSSARRRTPGLRREEVAQRADVSATWYTWLEQGRGGVPSTDTLDRISAALLLNSVEREHLFLLAQGRPPEVHVEVATGVTPRLQRVLDALDLSPAYVRTVAWDVVAWNCAAQLLIGDFGSLPPQARNIMRRLFCNPEMRERLPDWEHSARFLVAAFRTDVVRAGASTRVQALVNELCESSPEFRVLWRAQDVGVFGEGSKHLWHPHLGLLELEYSSFAVEGQPDLNMVVFSPATSDDRDRIRSLLATP
jgi:transcriptional regulator with XRE-family HTH domain